MTQELGNAFPQRLADVPRKKIARISSCIMFSHQV
jgi:hypothetical protein